MDFIKEYIISIVESYKTKDGKEITFKFYENSPKDKFGNEKGFVTHQLDAFIDGVEVGYIKISYIPYEKYKEIYPTIWHWLAIINGMFSFRNILNDLSIDNIYNVINNGRDSYRNIERTKEYKKETIEDFKKQYIEQFHKFKRYLVNKPTISYIKVDEDYRRLRIGQALYHEASKIMKERGMKLYASSTQTDYAKASWKFMLNNNKVSHKSGRRFIK